MFNTADEINPALFSGSTQFHG